MAQTFYTEEIVKIEDFSVVGAKPTKISEPEFWQSLNDSIRETQATATEDHATRFAKIKALLKTHLVILNGRVYRYKNHD